MKPLQQKEKLDQTINQLSELLEVEFSSRFKDLTPKEDRQLFLLAEILVKLKSVSMGLERTEYVSPNKLMKNRRDKILSLVD